MTEKDWNAFFWTPAILIIAGIFQFIKGQYSKSYIFLGIGIAFLAFLLIRKYRKKN